MLDVEGQSKGGVRAEQFLYFPPFLGWAGSGVSQPDEVTFRVLVRGYGECEPPRWLAISSLLQVMDRKYGIQPSALLYNALLEICARTRDQVIRTLF